MPSEHDEREWTVRGAGKVVGCSYWDVQLEGSVRPADGDVLVSKARFDDEACEPRGECPVCGGERDHHPNCEVGILEARALAAEQRAEVVRNERDLFEEQRDEAKRCVVEVQRVADEWVARRMAAEQRVVELERERDSYRAMYQSAEGEFKEAIAGAEATQQLLAELEISHEGLWLERDKLVIRAESAEVLLAGLTLPEKWPSYPEAGEVWYEMRTNRPTLILRVYSDGIPKGVVRTTAAGDYQSPMSQFLCDCVRTHPDDRRAGGLRR